MENTRLRYQSRQLVRMLGMLENACCGTALSPVQAHALGEIRSTPVSISQLAEILRVDKSNASRTVASLTALELVKSEPHPQDGRRQQITVTAAGIRLLDQLDSRQNRFFDDVLQQLSDSEQRTLRQGMEAYIRSLSQLPMNAGEYILRPLSAADNPAIASVIRTVSAEYGLTDDKGYGVSDPALDQLYDIYSQPRSGYWVIEHQGRVVGGGGFAPLKGAEDICELQKMYFLPEARGRGLAKRIVSLSETHARSAGFSRCYLETTACLKEAIALYEKLGFRQLPAAEGCTGHCDCEIPMARDLN